ncbi:MAG: 50S ribosomal protein L16, partial [Gammaproteobacteria bacterium]|nr:50S ribosomal protein L16 [Gammaproteobacteria bacterium]
EREGVGESVAREALALAAATLPFQTAFVKRSLF